MDVSGRMIGCVFHPLGELYSYTITVDTMFGGAATDLAAIVFGMVDTDEYWLARWHDPTGYYGTYSPSARLAIVRCLYGSCTELACGPLAPKRTS